MYFNSYGIMQVMLQVNCWKYMVVCVHYVLSAGGVASNSWRLLQLLQHVAYHVLKMVYLQQFMCNDILAMTIFDEWK